MKSIVLKSFLLSLLLSLGMVCLAADKEEAQFPGGNTELMKYLRNNIQYPEESLQNNEYGRVFVSFQVAEDGSIQGVKVVRSAAPRLDAEAVRVVSEMPKWSPKMVDGKAVRSNCSLPIVFHLPNKVLQK